MQNKPTKEAEYELARHGTQIATLVIWKKGRKKEIIVALVGFVKALATGKRPDIGENEKLDLEHSRTS